MTAIQILEKLGADASYNSNQVSENDRLNIIKESKDTAEFSAPLTHHSPLEDEENEDEDKDEDKDSNEKINKLNS